MCRGLWSIEYWTISLTPVAQSCGLSAPLMSSVGGAPPPDRIEPAASVPSTSCAQVWLIGPGPSLQLPTILPTSIWVIWPIFSAVVILPSKSFTRACTAACGSR